jgi:anhydro-N-acetylmuramic acid kinase
MTRSIIDKPLEERRTVGIMSGTSLDGVDVSIARFRKDLRLAESVNYYVPFPRKLRDRLLEIAGNDRLSKRDLLELDNELGVFYSNTVDKFLDMDRSRGLSVDLVGCHGQTVYHSEVRRRRVRALTLQIGSAETISQKLGVPVVSDFRSADIAAGGRGAPLTPIAHHYLFRQSGQSRIVVNIGGISNLTYLPSSCSIDSIVSSDCGPGNMLLDEVCRRLFGKDYDRAGKLVSKGEVDEQLLNYLKKMGFLRRKMPISLGREQFGSDVVDGILDFSGRHQIRSESVLATLSFFTAYCISRLGSKFTDATQVLVCGGGCHNLSIMKMLTDLFDGVVVTDTSVVDIDPDFVESISFALLANLTVDSVPGNLPNVTGASRKVILGKITLT